MSLWSDSEGWTWMCRFFTTTFQNMKMGVFCFNATNHIVKLMSLLVTQIQPNFITLSIGSCKFITWTRLESNVRMKCLSSILWGRVIKEVEKGEVGGMKMRTTCWPLDVPRDALWPALIAVGATTQHPSSARLRQFCERGGEREAKTRVRPPTFFELSSKRGEEEGKSCRKLGESSGWLTVMEEKRKRWGKQPDFFYATGVEKFVSCFPNQRVSLLKCRPENTAIVAEGMTGWKVPCQRWKACWIHQAIRSLFSFQSHCLFTFCALGILVERKLLSVMRENAKLQITGTKIN